MIDLSLKYPVNRHSGRSLMVRSSTEHRTTDKLLDFVQGTLKSPWEVNDDEPRTVIEQGARVMNYLAKITNGLLTISAIFTGACFLQAQDTTSSPNISRIDVHTQKRSS